MTKRATSIILFVTAAGLGGCHRFTAEGAGCDKQYQCPNPFVCDLTWHCAVSCPEGQVACGGFCVVGEACAADGGLPDAGAAPDAGRKDAGQPDAGATGDAGSTWDGGRPDAGGRDGGLDAGRAADAGTVDAGADAGPTALSCFAMLSCQVQACANTGTGTAKGLYQSLAQCVNAACLTTESGPCADQSSAACAACQNNAFISTCENQWNACVADTSGSPGPQTGTGCSALMSCRQNCSDQTCVNDCVNAASSAGQQTYEMLLDCTNVACPVVDGGPCGGSNTNSSRCQACEQNADQSGACASDYTACVNNTGPVTTPDAGPQADAGTSTADAGSSCTDTDCAGIDCTGEQQTCSSATSPCSCSSTPSGDGGLCGGTPPSSWGKSCTQDSDCGYLGAICYTGAVVITACTMACSASCLCPGGATCCDNVTPNICDSTGLGPEIGCTGVSPADGG